MTEDDLKELLLSVWDRETTVDEAWGIIEGELESSSGHDKEYWLQIRYAPKEAAR